MKNNILKYIFFIFIILIAIVTVYVLNNRENSKEENVENVAVKEETELEQTLNLGIAEFDTMNPILSRNKYVQNISKLIYEPLINIDNNYKLQNCIASEWAKTSETTYVIKLKENVTWSNGVNCTAEDVLYTIDKLKENVNSNIYIYNVQYIIQAEVVDKYTIKITLSQEIPFFEYNLNFPVMCKSYFGEEDFVNSEKSKMPIGTGKYRITELQADRIILIKRENYWAEKDSKIETIKINLYDSIGEM